MKLVEFADYQCPFCKQLFATINELQRRYPGRVTVVYRQYPLRSHPHAFEAAVAAECAAAQGRFPEFHDLLFEQQDSIGVESWNALAIQAGVVDTAAFQSCRGSQVARQRVVADTVVANRLGITATPTLVLQNELRSASLPIDTLEAWIRRIIPRALGS